MLLNTFLRHLIDLKRRTIGYIASKKITILVLVSDGIYLRS